MLNQKARETVSEYVARLASLVGDADPVPILRESPRVVLRLVASAPPEARARRPEPSRWSVNEIVAHLADAELVGGYRVRTLIAASGSPIQAYDQDRWHEASRYQWLDAWESAQLFQPIAPAISG